MEVFVFKDRDGLISGTQLAPAENQTEETSRISTVSQTFRG